MSAQDILKDFKGSLSIETDGTIIGATGILQDEFYNNKEFASTILSMLHDVNKITSPNSQEFKRLTVSFSDQTFIITSVASKVYVVVQ